MSDDRATAATETWSTPCTCDRSMGESWNCPNSRACRTAAEAATVGAADGCIKPSACQIGGGSDGFSCGRPDCPEHIEFAPHLDPAEPFSLSLSEFIARDRPQAIPLLQDNDGRTIVARNSLTLLGGLGGSGKTTLFTELALHLAAGVDYLCFKIPEPASVLLIENEGPEAMFAEKLEAKLSTFTHPLKARVGICTIEWGGFTLGDSIMRERLREDIGQHSYDLVFGDPLDSLGIEGVGSPEDTRKFLERLKETGLHRDVAWWLNTHPRKEETKEALNEISGAWGGKPDTVLLLRQLDDDRSQLRFPKLRWAKRGRRPAILLGFDVDTETFTYLGEESTDERDYLAEVKTLLADDSRWLTAKDIAAKRDDGGIGANVDSVKSLLEKHPDVFTSRTGDDAKAVGRHPSATVWQLLSEVTQALESPESPRVSAGEEEGGDSLTSPYRKSAESRHLTLHLNGDSAPESPPLEGDPGPDELPPLDETQYDPEEALA